MVRRMSGIYDWGLHICLEDTFFSLRRLVALTIFSDLIPSAASSLFSERSEPYMR
jgi:hypothetical protein